MAKKKNPYAVKMRSEELQMFLHFKRRGSKNTPKKGKGSFKRVKGADN